MKVKAEGLNQSPFSAGAGTITLDQPHTPCGDVAAGARKASSLSSASLSSPNVPSLTMTEPCNSLCSRACHEYIKLHPKSLKGRAPYLRNYLPLHSRHPRPWSTVPRSHAPRKEKPPNRWTHRGPKLALDWWIWTFAKIPRWFREGWALGKANAFLAPLRKSYHSRSQHSNFYTKPSILPLGGPLRNIKWPIKIGNYTPDLC